MDFVIGYAGWQDEVEPITNETARIIQLETALASALIHLQEAQISLYAKNQSARASTIIALSSAKHAISAALGA